MTVKNIVKKKRRKEHVAFYTKGELNYIIDSFLHPFFDEGNSFIILDGAVHTLLEKNVPKSAGKFVRYSLPLLLRRTSRKRKVRGTRSEK